MTMWREMDYLIELKMSGENINHITGHAFTSVIYRRDRKSPVKGMVVVPQLTNTNIKSENCEAWLWLDSKRSIITLEEKAKFKLTAPCDPSATIEKLAYFQRILPITLTGCINVRVKGGLSYDE
ncbi:hypothetical protein KO519_09480 [Paraglaciecola agarilytica]|uniref:hypothetical protein n=1 Tax=Paraglaciecola chathamensis TaxID=368405 RepID=UPI001C0A3037|nr:hypothetical protein [Paraglaciecola agarilytica]MBU3017919.1 hypothetical protein [Paraglaciecola agarilytica]